MATPYDGLYIDREYLSALALIPPRDYAFVSDESLAQIIRALQDMVDSMLFKRYAVPFVAPVPPTIKYNLSALVFDHLRGIGEIPSTTVDRIDKAANHAREYLRMAADSVTGLAELPLRQVEGGPGKSGISRGGLKAITHRTPWDYQRSRRRR
ncbi:MAG: DUF1320 family protein [Labilithrix sp.]|nr:DUF1320 family protein [Labilithrix sp.]